jgi:hypothetical protein
LGCVYAAYFKFVNIAIWSINCIVRFEVVFVTYATSLRLLRNSHPSDSRRVRIRLLRNSHLGSAAAQFVSIRSGFRHIGHFAATAAQLASHLGSATAQFVSIRSRVRYTGHFAVAAAQFASRFGCCAIRTRSIDGAFGFDCCAIRMQSKRCSSRRPVRWSCYAVRTRSIGHELVFDCCAIRIAFGRCVKP